MGNAITHSDIAIATEYCFVIFEEGLYRLDYNGDASTDGNNGIVLLDFGNLVFELELVTRPIQSISNSFMEVEKVLGIALCRNVGGVVLSSVVCTTLVSGHDTCAISFCLCLCAIETIACLLMLNRKV